MCFLGSYRLVNGSPTKEVNIQRGLKQVDPLVPFLFLLVAEELSGLIRNAVFLGKFKGFRVGNSDVVILNLQYADDTLLIGEACYENLWVMKSVLRFFELVSGLKVNFFKSCLGMNASEYFLGSGAEFLNYKVGGIPFRYLRLPVGSNARKCSTWQL